MQRDDRAIENEGIDNLTEEELRSACRARGMRAPFGSGAPAFMQKQLHDWLDLSLHKCALLSTRHRQAGRHDAADVKLHTATVAGCGLETQPSLQGSADCCVASQACCSD